jgi:hypothetical protein
MHLEITSLILPAGVSTMNTLLQSYVSMLAVSAAAACVTIGGGLIATVGAHR